MSETFWGRDPNYDDRYARKLDQNAKTIIRNLYIAFDELLKQLKLYEEKCSSPFVSVYSQYLYGVFDDFEELVLLLLHQVSRRGGRLTFGTWTCIGVSCRILYVIPPLPFK